MDFYTAQPHANVDVAMRIFGLEISQDNYFSLTFHGPIGGSVIVSSVPDDRGFLKEANFDGGTKYAVRIPEDATSSYVEFVALPDMLMSDEDEGTYVAHLPGIAFDEYANTDYPQLSAAGGDFDNGGLPMEMTKVEWPGPDSGVPEGDNDPSHYNLPGRHLLWEPDSLNARVQLQGVAEYLRDAHIDGVAPSSGTLVGDNFVWTADYGITPFVSATKSDKIERRSTLEFYSGVALGLAAAALLALLQEFRDV
jgi:hypothetical protein